MKNVDWKDVLVRSVKTFAETAIALLATELAGMDLFAQDECVWISLGLSAGAAGVAAVWNGVIEPLLSLPAGKAA